MPRTRVSGKASLHGLFEEMQAHDQKSVSISDLEKFLEVDRKDKGAMVLRPSIGTANFLTERLLPEPGRGGRHGPQPQH